MLSFLHVDVVVVEQLEQLSLGMEMVVIGDGVGSSRMIYVISWLLKNEVPENVELGLGRKLMLNSGILDCEKELFEDGEIGFESDEEILWRKSRPESE